MSRLARRFRRRPRSPHPEEARGSQPTARRPRRRGWLIAGLLSLVAAAALFLPNAGAWLVVEDPFGHAATAVVLSGGPVHRSLAARDLYRHGRVDRILIIPEPEEPAQAELVKLGLIDLTRPPTSLRILLASGVPADRITMLPESADGTIEEARVIRRWFGERLPPSLVIVTSKFASRRARLIFRAMFQHDPVRIVVVPTAYDPFQPTRWWRRPKHALFVVTEYQKLVANAVTLALDRRRK